MNFFKALSIEAKVTSVVTAYLLFGGYVAVKLAAPTGGFSVFVFIGSLVIGAVLLAGYTDEFTLLTKNSPDSESISLYDAIRPDLKSGTEYVYIIQETDFSHFCKIGRSSNLSGRLYNFGVKLPFNHNLIHIIECEYGSITESVLHRYFADKRKNGEWFSLSDSDIEMLKAIKKM